MESDHRDCQRILAYLDAQSRVAALTDPGFIVAFRREGQAWNEVARVALDLGRLGEMRQFRHFMEGLAEVFLPPCPLLLSRSQGTPAAVLASMGYRPWVSSEDIGTALAVVGMAEAASGQSHGVSDNGQGRDEAACGSGGNACSCGGGESAAPLVERDEGTDGLSYVINLVREDGAHVASRPAVLPLLRKGGFSRLSLIASGRPCWLDAECRELGFDIRESLGDDKLWRIELRPTGTSGS